MKQRLSINDLMELNSYQQDRIQQLWIPQKYDVVIAKICTDVLNDQYEQIELVIGDIIVQESNCGRNCSIIIRDLRSLNNEFVNENDAEIAQTSETETMTEFEDEILDDENFLFPDSGETTQFDFFGKDDCLPLLSIGQIIEMLQRSSYGDANFHLTIPSEVAGDDVLVGRDNYAADYEGPELCDVLWECLKSRL